MSARRLEPLSADLTALLDAERAIPPVDAAFRARLRGRILSSIGFVGGPGGDGGGSPTSGAPHATAPAGSLPPPATGLLARIGQAKALIAGAFVAGGVLGAGLTGGVTARSPTPPVLESGVPRVIVVTTPASGNAAPAVTATPERVEVPKSLTPRTRAGPPEPKTRDTDLAAESALLSIARTAVGRGDAPAALNALRAHKRKFPAGRLSEERDSLWVQALALSGDESAAKRQAQQFKQRYPESFLNRAVDQAVRDEK